jgi:GT2 family glycosyltransferase
MPPRLWVVLVNYNGLGDTRKCLQSLGEVTYPDLSTVVVDNASVEDPTPVLRAEFPGARLVRNAVNGGWAGGNNTGIAYALAGGADVVVLLNNDTVIAPDFAGRLAAAATAFPAFGILGPVINHMDEPGVVMTDGCVFNRPGYNGFFQRLPVPLAKTDPPSVTEVDIVNGCCMMIRRAVFERVGLIDERFFLVHEESDFCLRARRAGYRCGVLGETLVWHKGSSAITRSGKRFQRYYDARNLSLLLRKHLATHCTGRGAWGSRLQYLKYVYYRYAIEREEGRPAAADAVLEGVWDAVAGRYGPYEPAPRPAVPVLRGLFESLRRRRARRPKGGPQPGPQDDRPQPQRAGEV